MTTETVPVPVFRVFRRRSPTQTLKLRLPIPLENKFPAMLQNKRPQMVQPRRHDANGYCACPRFPFSTRVPVFNTLTLQLAHFSGVTSAFLWGMTSKQIPTNPQSHRENTSTGPTFANIGRIKGCLFTVLQFLITTIEAFKDDPAKAHPIINPPPSHKAYVHDPWLRRI